MRYRNITLKGYIGIYNGLHLDTITIDFDLCIHNLIVIKGDTGSGKSTLFKALTPLPDQSYDFIPGQNASKVITISHEGYYYVIQYDHIWKGDSFVSKGQFYKGTCREDMVLCNANCNITACKDLVYSEFNLDPAFLELTELSNTNRGIITSTPALRKQNFNSIISGVEIYNQMYKTLNKRSAVFKSMINSLTAKIKSIGNEELVKVSMNNTNQSMLRAQALIEEHIAKIAQAEAIIARLDPDGSLQQKYTNLSSRQNDLETNMASLLRQHKEANSDPILVEQSIANATNKIQELTERRDNLSREVTRLIDLANTESEKLNIKRAKLDSLGSHSNYDDMITMRDNFKTSIKEMEDFFNQYNLKYQNISSAEYMTGLNALNDIQNQMRIIYDSYSEDIIKKAVHCYSYEEFIESYDIVKVTNVLNDNKELLENLESEIRDIESKQKMYNTMLADRPNTCKDDTCPYISKGIEIKNSLPSDSVIADMYTTRCALLDKISENNAVLYMYTSVHHAFNDISKLILAIKGQKMLLDKLSPHSDEFVDEDKFLYNLVTGNIPDISAIYDTMSLASTFDNYKTVKENLKTIEAEISIYEAKHELIDEIMADISRLDGVISKAQQSIIDNNAEIANVDRLLETSKAIKSNLVTLLDYAKEYKASETMAKATSESLREINQAIKDINTAKSTISILTDKLASYRQDATVLNKKYSELEYSLSRLEEYKGEMELFEAKYEKIEFMKKCCSPTKSGIQNIFIALYLNDIMRTANKLLAMVFDSMTLLQPVINDRVFNFPCIGDGLPHDDVSSLSGGQSAIMSVVLSGAIMYHASSKYNIFKFDEVDGQLDSSLRPRFLPIIDEIRVILRCEQCFAISHNEALDLRNVDLIILKTSDQDVYNSGGNIIYRY